MEITTKPSFFTHDKHFYRSLFLLALPIALQNFVTFSVGLADNVMIGSLGDSAVSGVYMANQIQTVLQVITTGMEGSILILSAQYWGKQDTVSIRKILSIGTRFSLFVGILFTLCGTIFPTQILSLFSDETELIESGADYLQIVAFSYVFFCLTQSLIAGQRSVETAKIGLYVSLVSLVVDIGLNYVFIFGKLGFPEMGVKGAALATLIARVVECAVIVTYTFGIDKKLKVRPYDFLSLDKPLLHDFVKYGSPILAGQLVWGANLIANSVIMGKFDMAIVTGLSLTNTMNNLCYVVMNGMAGAVGILIGKAIGEGGEDFPVKIRQYSHSVQVIFLCLGFVTSGVLLLIRNPFLSLYNVTPEALTASREMLNVLQFTIIGTCYQCACLFGLVKSGGDISFVFRNDTVFVFGVVIPSAVIALLCGAPYPLVFFFLKIDQLLKCIVAFFKIRKYNWMKNLTR